MHPLLTLSAKKLNHLIRTKEVSCVEIMQEYLKHIATINPMLNAIVEPADPNTVLAQARKMDKKIAHKETVGKLAGVPITIKQARQVKGFLCNFGNESPMNFVAQEDATVVARLRAEDAFIMGVTNIPDFSMSYETDCALYGCTHNPYDLARSPGGSSGGEAAIIAAAGSLLGIGADSGGSIRQPAHHCGVVGLKPTRGLIPSTGKFPQNGLGIFNLIETQGPLARYVEDIIYTLPIISGPDQADPNVLPITGRDPNDVDLKSLRVIFYTHNGVASPSAEIDNTVKEVVKSLSKKTAHIEESYPDVSKESYTCFEELFFYGGDRGKWLRDNMAQLHVEKVARPFKAILDRAAQCEFSVTELRHRLFLLEKFKFTMMAYFKEADVIICPVVTDIAGLYNNPTAQVMPNKLDLAYDLTYNLPYNIMGWPALSLRCGTSKEGMPIGVQIIAKSWREDIVLAVAHYLEAVFEGWKPPKIGE